MPSTKKLCELLLALLLINTILTTTTKHCGHVEGAKILGLFAHSSESHFAVMRSIVLELTKRQHDVTVYSSHRLNERIENLQEIIIEPEFPFWRQLESDALGKGRAQGNDLTKLAALSPKAMQQALASAGGAAVDYFLSHPAVVELLQRSTTNFDYDLIIVDLFYTEALLALGYAHKTPTVAIVSSNFEDYMQHVLECGMPICSSDRRGTDSNNADDAGDVGFWQFWTSVYSCIARRKQFTGSNHAMQEKLVAKHFSKLIEGTTTTVRQLQSQVGVMLLNNHAPLVRAQPMLVNSIFAGGMHIRAPRELPWHVRRFLDDSRIGVIYVHLGNEQQCGSIPAERLQVLFDSLSARKEHVLWTCHDVEKLPNQPQNFMLQHMVAQTDILAHPHVKVFITNGDIVAVQEGIMRHVPMLSIPLFRHEIDNVAIAQHLGITISLDFNNVTVLSLNAAVEQLLENPAYQHSIRRVAKTYRDRPLGALETCMYWIDYVLRHKDNQLLKTHMFILFQHISDLLFFSFFFALGQVLFIIGCGYAIYRYLPKKKIYRYFQRQRQQRNLKLN